MRRRMRTLPPARTPTSAAVSESPLTDPYAAGVERPGCDYPGAGLRVRANLILADMRAVHAHARGCER